MNVTRNIDRLGEERPRPSDGEGTSEGREPTPRIVRREKQVFRETVEKKKGGLWQHRWKIVAAGVGAYLLYHFRFWMREKLHLAFSKVPQSEIEGNMSTTAVLGRPNRALPGNGERAGTNTGDSVAGPIQ